MTLQTALAEDQMKLELKLCSTVVCVIHQRKGATIHVKLDELRLACVQDVIFIFLVWTFSGASVGKYDTSGISSIILRIQGHICFLVMVSKENSFCICNPLSRNRQFICLAAASLQNNCMLYNELIVQYNLQLCRDTTAFWWVNFTYKYIPLLLPQTLLWHLWHWHPAKKKRAPRKVNFKLKKWKKHFEAINAAIRALLYCMVWLIP